MPSLVPLYLEDDYVVLEPLTLGHAPALEAAAADGELWKLWFTSAPAPGEAASYIAIREKATGEIIGTTRFYDFVAELPRVAIGYTWYAKRWQKSHVNTACKRLLFKHAFESLDCVAVEFHTDGRNLDSQRAIERLGARRDGVLRAHKRRPDGSLRDTVCYSVIASEWADVSKWLTLRLERLAG
jgi:N-acetyltransferase